jgi:hypothetical protein
MALSITESGPLLKPSELRYLVDAVFRASAHDEDRHVEWKSGRLDLTTAAGWESLARHIIGFANRDPATVSNRLGGYGYVLVGVEPGELSGVATVDPATLVGKLREYVGTAIRWSPEYVKAENVTVLIIIVDPPAQGDPIYCLRRPINGKQAGTIFVRHTGRTDPANPADIEMLQSRFASTLSSTPRRERATIILIIFLAVLVVARGPVLDVYTHVLEFPALHSYSELYVLILISVAFWFTAAYWMSRTFLFKERSGIQVRWARVRTLVLGLGALLVIVGVSDWVWEKFQLGFKQYPYNVDTGTYNYKAQSPLWIISAVTAATGIMLGISAAWGGRLSSIILRFNPTSRRRGLPRADDADASILRYSNGDSSGSVDGLPNPR